MNANGDPKQARMTIVWSELQKLRNNTASSSRHTRIDSAALHELYIKVRNNDWAETSVVRSRDVTRTLNYISDEFNFC